MLRRPFYAMLGLGAGVALGIWVVRKLEDTQRKLTPEELSRSTAARATSFADRVREAVAEGRVAAAQREAELRAEHRPRDPQRTPPGPGPWDREDRG